MKEFSFSECRAHLDIGLGFSGDNMIVTDGDPARLPRLKLIRHGNPNVEISGVRIEIAESARGMISIFVAQSESVVRIGAETRCNINIRLWRSPLVEIGAYTTINNARIVADNSEVRIGPDCLFSDEILIQSSDQHGLIDLADEQFINSGRRQVEIGEHVWIGRRATLMPGARVGDGSVIGAGSIVTGPADLCSYYVGVPARKVREGASWTRLPGVISQREREFFDRLRCANLMQGGEAKSMGL